MTERFPRFGSKRFREVLWPALVGDLFEAISGIYWFVTRRRVRGWSILLRAAARGPNSYRRWIKTGEERVFSLYRQGHPRQRQAQFVPLIIVDEPASPANIRRSVASLRGALGEDVLIYSTSPTNADCTPLPGTNGKYAAAALSFLRGDERDIWVVPVVAGDLVSPQLRETLERAIECNAGIALVYWDEDLIGPQGRFDPWIKPQWDELLFDQVGGLAGASAISLSAILDGAESKSVQQLNRTGVELLSFGIATRRLGLPPAHVPLILTHRALENAPTLTSKAPQFKGAAAWPTVSIVVPTRDKAELLRACLRGLDELFYSGGVELIIVDNGSIEPAALRLIARLERDGRAKVLRDPGPFNFSRLNNLAAAVADGEFLCFLNNDVEPTEGTWLTTMVSYAREPGVGAVGALLLYPGGRIQHAGVAIGLGRAAGHVQKGVDPADRRFWTWHAVTREVSAVTAAVMVVRKSTFFEAGGFDEVAFPVAFNDVDLCLRLKAAGRRNIYAAEARLIHRESESRGSDRAADQAMRFAGELKRLQERWHTEDFLDPHYSPLFSREIERCVLAP